MSMTAIEPVPFHEAARVFPLLAGPEFDQMVEDIRANGLLVPIELFQDEIIDGRNRYRACQQLGIEPDFVEVEPDDPISYVISLNLHRRHLNESQRAMVGARAKDFYAERAKKRMLAGKQQDPPANLPEGSVGDARDQAGAAVNVSGKSVDAASKVIEKGTEELKAEVDAGNVAVSIAAKLAELPKAAQKKAVAGGKAAIKKAVTPRKPESPKVQYPATEHLDYWMGKIDFGMGMIRQEYGSVAKMIAGPGWDKSRASTVVGLFNSVCKDLVQFNKELQKLCPKR